MKTLEKASDALLDKDWGAKIPEYITKGTFSVAVFFMSLTMRGETKMLQSYDLNVNMILTPGDWLMFLAHYWRSQEPLPSSSLLSDQINDGNQTETELAMWFNEK